MIRSPHVGFLVSDPSPDICSINDAAPLSDMNDNLKSRDEGQCFLRGRFIFPSGEEMSCFKYSNGESGEEFSEKWKLGVLHMGSTPLHTASVTELFLQLHLNYTTSLK
jgi:hypothetical protein